jgi:hypothetical protein
MRPGLRFSRLTLVPRRCGPTGTTLARYGPSCETISAIRPLFSVIFSVTCDSETHAMSMSVRTSLCSLAARTSVTSVSPRRGGYIRVSILVYLNQVSAIGPSTTRVSDSALQHLI